MSELINNAVKESIIEDVEDNEPFAERVNEDLVSYDAMIRKLKTMGSYKIFFTLSHSPRVLSHYLFHPGY